MADYFSKQTKEDSKNVVDDEAVKGSLPEEQYQKVLYINWLLLLRLCKFKVFAVSKTCLILFLFLAEKGVFSSGYQWRWDNYVGWIAHFIDI